MTLTAVSTATLWVFSAAALANNTSEASLHQVQFWVLAFTFFAIVAIAAGIGLLCLHRPGWATLTSLVPALTMACALLYLIFAP